MVATPQLCTVRRYSQCGAIFGKSAIFGLTRPVTGQHALFCVICCADMHLLVPSFQMSYLSPLYVFASVCESIFSDGPK
jgi:hypothetical protein